MSGEVVLITGCLRPGMAAATMVAAARYQVVATELPARIGIPPLSPRNGWRPEANLQVGILSDAFARTSTRQSTERRPDRVWLGVVRCG